jgi:shikimate dehydrogenase
VNTAAPADRAAAPDRYAVLGHPVAHSRSPWIHARFAEATGERVEYGRIECPLDGFEPALRGFMASGARGCNVTVPFKFEAFRLAVRTSERARLAQAANTLRFEAEGIVADNTDGIGLLRDIEQHAGRPLAGLRVLLVGAGGAGAGVLGPLLQARPALLQLVNRSADKAQALAERHAPLAQHSATVLTAGALDTAGEGFDVVVNASASSLAGAAASPVPSRVLAPGALAVDLMYGAAARPFLRWAADHGAVGRDGLGMLVEQAAEAFAFWRGVRPDTAPVLAALRALVDAA